MSKWRCNGCDEMFEDGELLNAPSPFDKDDILTACPSCKTVEDFDEICDEEGCGHKTTCGFPTENGYRRTCHEHSIYKKG